MESVPVWLEGRALMCMVTRILHRSTAMANRPFDVMPAMFEIRKRAIKIENIQRDREFAHDLVVCGRNRDEDAFSQPPIPATWVVNTAVERWFLGVAIPDPRLRMVVDVGNQRQWG